MPATKEYYLWVNKKWCKRCYACVEFCPKRVYDIGPEGEVIKARPEDCIACSLCVMICPDFAIVDDAEMKEQIVIDYNIKE